MWKQDLSLDKYWCDYASKHFGSKIPSKAKTEVIFFVIAEMNYRYQRVDTVRI